jgi:hypothetical protein
MHAVPHALLLGVWVASWPTRWLSIVPCPPSPPWAGRDGEGRSGSKVAKGQREAAIEDCGEACGARCTRCLTRSNWAVGSSVDRHIG